MRNTIRSIFPLMSLLLICTCLPGCSGGHQKIIVGDIEGPSSLEGRSPGEYTISVKGGEIASILWSTNPPDAGAFSTPEAATTRFMAKEFQVPTTIEIWVVINPATDGSIVKKKNVTIEPAGLWAGEIKGPYTIAAESYYTYSIDAGGDAGIAYEWSCNMPELCIIESLASSETRLYFLESVPKDTLVEINVLVSSNNYDPIRRTIVITVLTELLFFVNGIAGPESIDENSSVTYSVEAISDTDITYEWSCIPQDVGTFAPPDSAATEFTVGKMCNETHAEIHVGVSSTGHEPVDRILGVIIKDTDTWVRTWGINTWDFQTLYLEARDMASDQAGNIYMVGDFYGIINFAPNPKEDLQGIEDMLGIFLSKISPTGEYQWTRVITPPPGVDFLSFIPQTLAGGIIIDGMNDIYITGGFNGIYDFDPGTGEDIRESHYSFSAYRLSIFLCKFDINGDIKLAVTWGDEGEPENFSSGYGKGVSVDYLGNIYLTGGFTGIRDFDPGPNVYLLEADMTDGNYYDVPLIKLSPDGSFTWAINFGSTRDDWGNHIGTDEEGNIYIGGYRKSTMQFPDSGGTELAGSGIFLSSYDASGSFRWAQSPWDGLIPLLSSYNITSDKKGNLHIAALGRPPALHLFKYDTDGDLSLHGWFPYKGKPNIDVDAQGNIYLTGHTLYTAYTGSNALLAKYDENATPIWERAWGDLEDLYFFNSVGGSQVVIADSGSIYVYGQYDGHIDFDPGPGECLRYYDHKSHTTFLSKFNQDGYW